MQFTGSNQWQLLTKKKEWAQEFISLNVFQLDIFPPLYRHSHPYAQLIAHYIGNWSVTCYGCK